MNPTLQHGIELAKKNWEFGNALEFGVASGTTLRQIVSEFLSMPSVGVYGFDSCEGLPEDWPGTECKKGAFTNNGNIPDVPMLDKFYKGWFEETLGQYCADVPDTVPIILLHLDADLYSSTISVLQDLNDRIKVNTVIVCDEWGREGDQNCIDQERKALWEWTETFGREVVRVEGVVDDTPCGDQRAVFMVTK